MAVITNRSRVTLVIEEMCRLARERERVFAEILDCDGRKRVRLIKLKDRKEILEQKLRKYSDMQLNLIKKECY